VRTAYGEGFLVAVREPQKRGHGGALSLCGPDGLPSDHPYLVATDPYTRFMQLIFIIY